MGGFATATAPRRRAASRRSSTCRSTRSPRRRAPCPCARSRSAAPREHRRRRFWGGVVPGNAGELEALNAAGVKGFKSFLVPSGVDEFPAVGERDLRQAMPVDRAARRAAARARRASGPDRSRDTRRTRGRRAPAMRRWLASRPPEAEVEAIRHDAAFVSRTRAAACIIVHLAAPGRGARGSARARERAASGDGRDVPALSVVRRGGRARRRHRVQVRARRCSGRGNRERLWGALADGTIDLVASDHLPCPPAPQAL